MQLANIRVPPLRTQLLQAVLALTQQLIGLVLQLLLLALRLLLLTFALLRQQRPLLQLLQLELMSWIPPHPHQWNCVISEEQRRQTLQPCWVKYSTRTHILFMLSFVIKLAFSASWPSVLWRCWLGDRKGIRPVKNWVMWCWCGYLSGARCRLFAYGPADATASQNPIVSCLILIPGCLGKEAVKPV